MGKLARVTNNVERIQHDKLVFRTVQIYNHFFDTWVVLQERFHHVSARAETSVILNNKADFVLASCDIGKHIGCVADERRVQIPVVALEGNEDLITFGMIRQQLGHSLEVL